MEQTLARPRVFARRPLTALRLTHLAALGGIALACVYLQAVLIGVVLPPAVVFTVVTVALIGLVLTGWRWAPLLGAAWSIFLLLGNAEVIVYYIGRPAMPHEFIFHLALIALTAVGAVSGVAAVGERGSRAPRWLVIFVGAVVFLVLGASAAALLPGYGSVATGASREAIADLPVLKAGNLAFDKAEIRVRAGEPVALRLENSDVGVHAFDIDELGVHVPIGGGSSSFVYFRPTTPGTYTYYCSIPHHDPMRGTLVVEP